MTWTVVVIWLVGSIAVAALANAWERATFVWLLLSLLLSPPIAGLLLVLLPPNTAFNRKTIYRGVYYRDRRIYGVDALIEGEIVRFRSMRSMRAAIDRGRAAGGKIDSKRKPPAF